MRPSLFLTLCAGLLVAAPGLVDAGSARGSSSLAAYNSFGDSVVVSNNYDGSSYWVRLSRLNRNGAVNREQTHADGYHELVRALSFDDDGSVYVAGLRYWQAARYLWAIKYNPSGNVEWEWSDDRGGCDASDVEVNAQGETWLAGHCVQGSSHALRLVRLTQRGYPAWARDYDSGGPSRIQDLHIDAGNRAALTAAAGAQVVTIVVDGQGRNVTTY